MTTQNPEQTSWVDRLVMALVFISVGGVIMVVLKPWGRDMIPDRVDQYLIRLGVSLGLFLAVQITCRITRLGKYCQVVNGLFILSVAVSLDWVLGRFLYDTLGLSDSRPLDWALQKLHECLLIAAVVIVFTRLSGGNLGSIYIQKGRLKTGLMIGGATFLAAAAGSVPMANLLFNARDLTAERMIPWIPWLLLVVLSNATLEELLFRGLFLRKLEPFFGKFIPVLLVAVVFTLLHKGVAYTTNELIFLAATFPLAILWGVLMQKTDSLWGSILFHAGMDIPIFLGLFSNL